MIAVSTYIRLLREASGISQEQAAARAKISAKTLGRWEKGETEHEPGVTKLKQLVLALGGSAKDALQLLVHDGATEEDGEAAAQMWLELSPEERQRVDNVLDSNIMPDELIEVLSELRADYQDDRSLATMLRGVLLSGRASGRGTRKQ